MRNARLFSHPWCTYPTFCIGRATIFLGKTGRATNFWGKNRTAAIFLGKTGRVTNFLGKIGRATNFWGKTGTGDKFLGENRDGRQKTWTSHSYFWPVLIYAGPCTPLAHFHNLLSDRHTGGLSTEDSFSVLELTSDDITNYKELYDTFEKEHPKNRELIQKQHRIAQNLEDIERSEKEEAAKETLEGKKGHKGRVFS